MSFEWYNKLSQKEKWGVWAVIVVIVLLVLWMVFMGNEHMTAQQMRKQIAETQCAVRYKKNSGPYNTCVSKYLSGSENMTAPVKATVAKQRCAGLASNPSWYNTCLAKQNAAENMTASYNNGQITLGPTTIPVLPRAGAGVTLPWVKPAASKAAIAAHWAINPPSSDALLSS